MRWPGVLAPAGRRTLQRLSSSDDAIRMSIQFRLDLRRCAASDRSAELWERYAEWYLLYLTGPMGHRQESPYATNSIILDTTYPTARYRASGTHRLPQMLTTYPQFAVGSALASPVFATEPVDVNAAACHGAGSCDAPFYASGYISPVPNIWPWSNPDQSPLIPTFRLLLRMRLA